MSSVMPSFTLSQNDSLWVLAPEHAESVFRVYRDELSHRENSEQGICASHGEPDVNEVAHTITRHENGVCVITVDAPIDRTSLFGWFSGSMFAVGQDAIKTAFAQALNDPSIRAVLLSINSPGGVVSGIKELADYIADSRKNKPIAAYVNGMAASGAYWLASSTGRVLAPATGQVGSIGVIMRVDDWSGAYQRQGVKVEYIASGRWKSAGRGDRPLTDDERQYFQERLAALHTVFRNDVAGHMGITAPPEQWSEAQVMLAPQAKAVGLVSDLVRDVDAAIKIMLEVSMPTYTLEALAKEAPELVAGLKEEGRREAEKELVAALQEKLTAASRNGADMALTAMRAVCRAEDVDAVETMMKKATALGLSPEQLSGVAELFAAAIQRAGHESGTSSDSRQSILTALQNAHTAPVNAVSFQNMKSPLVADAERRTTSGL